MSTSRSDSNSTMETDDHLTTKERLEAVVKATTIHGLPKLLHVSRIRRISWWLIMISVTCFVVVHWGILTLNFISDEINIDVRIVEARELEFPAVTVCNANPIKKSALLALSKEVPALQAIVDMETKKKRRRKRDLTVGQWSSYDYPDGVRVSYYIGSKTEIYADAKATCGAEGASLVWPLSPAAADDLAASVSTNTYFLDLHDDSGTGTFLRSDGSAPSGLSWHSTEPDGTPEDGSTNKDAFCVMYKDGFMEDTNCDSKYNYICEKDVQSSQSETTTSETRTEIATQPTTTETTTQSIAVSTAESILQSTIKSTAESTIESTAESTAELITETTAQLTDESSTDITLDTQTEPTTSSTKEIEATQTIITTTTDLNGCTCSPCLNGATCIHHNAGFECRCTANFVGTNCQTAREEPVDGGESVPFQKEEKITQILAGVPIEIKSAIGYQTNDIIFQCRYNGHLCNMDTSFSNFYNAFHGNCYTFNGALNATLSGRRVSTLPGRRHGLEMGINIGQAELLSATGGVAGAILVIHSTLTMPFPEDDGIMLRPGAFNVISLRKIGLTRMSKPYGNCINDNVDTVMKNVFQELYNTTYSKKACIRTCHQRHMIDACGCALSYYPKTGKAFGNRTVPVCNDDTYQQHLCVLETEELFAKNKLQCDCPSACGEIVYKPLKSNANWPLLSRKPAVLHDLKTMYPQVFAETILTPDVQQDEKLLKNNFLKVVIFYEDLNHEIISEFPVYSVFSYISDVGGLLGLWIGMSSLSLFEYIEFIVKTIHRSYQRSRKTPRINTVSALGAEDIDLRENSRDEQHKNQPSHIEHSDINRITPL